MSVYKHHAKIGLKQLVFAVVVLGIALFVASQHHRFDLGFIIKFLEENRKTGALVYVIYLSISSFVAFLPIVPVWPVAFHLYGFVLSVVLTWIGILIGSSICFWISRRFGKELVERLIGKKVYAEMVHLVSNFNDNRFFLLVRLLGNNYFDYISLLAGLSKMTYKSYITITATASAIWMLIIFSFLNYVGGVENFQSLLKFVAGYGGIALVGVIMWEIFHRKHPRGKKK